VSVPTLEADPATGPARLSLPAPEGREGPKSRAGRERRQLRAERRTFADVPRETWDRLAALNPAATPFSAWAFHRAWWDAYGDSAHEETLVIVDPGEGASAGTGTPIAIVPLMHRHVVEPRDAETHTTIRHGAGVELTPVEPTAKAVYFGASYHADYATLLCDPRDLPEVADAICELLEDETRPNPDHPAPWDVVDLRRLRRADPATDALAAAFGHHEMAEGWTLNIEQEDVCPVATIPAGDMDDYLATLGKKERHEIRRKVHRAEAVGPVALVESADPLAPSTAPGAAGRTDLDQFIDLHQAKWGAAGLFPDTSGGAASRVFFRRLFELFGRPAEDGSGDADGYAGSLRLSFLTVGDARIGASVHFETADSILYYNAGVDPEHRTLSPGVLMVEGLVRRVLETGRTRLDFLRGNEGYKYEWGAVDEPIQRLLVRRGVAR
jgi:CelD/BcsL family acetyltransferase involved in cellulose biosynthesis